MLPKFRAMLNKLTDLQGKEIIRIVPKETGSNLMSGITLQHILKHLVLIISLTFFSTEAYSCEIKNFGNNYLLICRSRFVATKCDQTSTLSAWRMSDSFRRVLAVVSGSLPQHSATNNVKIIVCFILYTGMFKQGNS